VKNFLKLNILLALNCIFSFSLYSQTIFPQAKDCVNQLDKKGNRKGEWLIAYSDYDWGTSMTKTIIDIGHLKEVKVSMTQSVYFIENVKYKGGMKSGIGYFYIYDREEKKAKPLAIVNYLEGKINGDVLFYREFNSRNTYAKVTYKNGFIADQTIEKSPSIIDGHQFSELDNFAIRNYEIILNGRSIELQTCMNPYKNYPKFDVSKYWSYQIMAKHENILYKEVTEDNLNRTITFIPFSLEIKKGIITLYQQKCKLDILGNILNYGNVKVYETKDFQNCNTSNGKYTTDDNIEYIDQRRYGGVDLIKKHIGELPWTYIEGLNTEKSCLVYETNLDPNIGLPNNETISYYFNEELEPKIPNNQKIIRLIETHSKGVLEGVARIYFSDKTLVGEMNFKNGNLDGSAYIYYPDKTLAAEMNFKNGKLDGRFNSLFNPTYNFIYIPNFLKNNNENYYVIDADKVKLNAQNINTAFTITNYVKTSIDLFKELGTITNCNYSKPKTYKEIIYACDFNENKLASDIVYFYNQKNIIFRQSTDLTSFTDKDWTYYNTDGNVCLTEAQAIAMYYSKKEKQQADLQSKNQNNSNSKSGQNNQQKTIANAIVNGSFIEITYDNSSHYPRKVGICSLCQFAGFNSNYIVIIEKNRFAKIYDANGNDTGRYVSICSSCQFHSVGPSSIIIKENNGILKRYDFNGNYIGK
jgi:antitoxin component YwqK of YwqJK toxin-antitoxin module